MLIDGDGMIFDDDLISKGELGGREAAGLLWNAVTNHVHQNISDLPSDYKIVTRIYANLKGLGDICHRSGIMENSNLMEGFARGFTGSKQLFDFIDVGMGKDRADDKISGKLLLILSTSNIADWSKKFSSCIYMIVIVGIYCLAAPMIMVTPDCSKMLQILQY